MTPCFEQPSVFRYSGTTGTCKIAVLLWFSPLPVSDASAGVAQRRVVRSHTDKKNEQMLEGIKVMKNHMKPLGCT